MHLAVNHRFRCSAAILLVSLHYIQCAKLVKIKQLVKEKINKKAIIIFFNN